MSGSPGVERLSEHRYIVLLLRLMIDGQGRVVHGDVGAFEEEEEKQRWHTGRRTRLICYSPPRV